VAAAGPKAESPYQVNWPPGIVTVTIVAASRHVPSATSAASAATNSATAAASELPVPAPVLIQEYLSPVRSAQVEATLTLAAATAPGGLDPDSRAWADVAGTRHRQVPSRDAATPPAAGRLSGRPPAARPATVPGAGVRPSIASAWPMPTGSAGRLNEATSAAARLWVEHMHACEHVRGLAGGRS
jgi:hypothetical protein